MSSGEKLLHGAAIMAAIILLCGGITHYIEGNKMALTAYNKTPKDHPNYGWEMQYRLNQRKYNHVYRYKAEGDLPSSFNDNVYLTENPDDAVYMAHISGKDGDPWLVIFSDRVPKGHGIVYKK